MDGSYGNVLPPSSRSPSMPPPSQDAYKINVNRQKTKKWANFKPQNYDGDDWGADDDEAKDQPEPPLPPKPMGPRHPTASSSAPRQFQPPGTAPIYTHTRQPVGAPAAGTGQPLTVTEQNASYRPYVPGGDVSTPSGYSSSQGYPHPLLSPNSRRNSPSPHSASSLPSQQVGLRKDSPGPYDAVDSNSAVKQPRPNQQTADNSDARTATSPMSPQNPRSFVSADKPLPFIRPADVYRRMAEEAKGGRQPLETRTLSMDSPVAQPSQRPEPSQARLQAGISSPLGLPAPPAERKSEYGIEGLLDSYSDDARVDPSSEVEMSTRAATTGQDGMKSAVPHPSAELKSHERVRRFSTSPKLPDLARMSGFGEDLFSSSLFPDSKAQSQTSEIAPPQLVIAPADSANAAEISAQSPLASTLRDTPSAAASDIEKMGKPNPDADTKALPVRSPSPSSKPERIEEQALQKVSGTQPVTGVSEQQQATGGGSLGAQGTRDQFLSRPHLPGGWVSETPSSPGEISHADPSQEQGPSAVGSGMVSSAAEANAQPQSPPLGAEQPQQPGPETAGDVRVSRPVEREVQATSHPASPRAIPSPRTSSPARNTELEKPSPEATANAKDGDAPPPASRRSSSSVSMGITTHPSEIPPTAPLNPRRESPAPGADMKPVMGSPPFETPSVVTPPALDASSNSPVKDSDMLSEEILKSLSPALPASTSPDPAEASTAAYRAAAGPVRESSYLGDVYDDYWTATEEKVDPSFLESGKTVKTERVTEAPISNPADSPDQQPIAPSSSLPNIGRPAVPSTTEASVDHTATATEQENSQRPFSWEPLKLRDPAEAPSPVTGMFVEQKALGSGVRGVSALGPKTVVPEDKALPLISETKAAHSPTKTDNFTPVPDEPPAGNTSRRSLSSASGLSDRHEGAQKLSLIEEKIALQEQSKASPLASPLEKHPALAEALQTQQAMDSSAPLPRKEAFNVLSFRNIMDIGSPAERIKHYNETRSQYSAMDSGLDEWVKVMLSKHPEHANTGFTYPGPAPNAQQGSQGAGTALPQNARPSASIGMPSQPYGSGGLGQFGHSSHQMGTKSRELLMAAGKAGKGLLSKGRNKLRGTGDKVFSTS